MTSGDLSELQARRFRLLEWVYEQTAGLEENHVNLAEHTAEFGWELPEIDSHARYLVAERLLTFTIKGYWVAITHRGVKEVERALIAPDQPTTHFQPLNVMIVQNMVNSQVQQGTNESTQARGLPPDPEAPTE
jgi:hypothetical protein